MKIMKAMPILLILLGSTCIGLSAQTLGQFSGASAAADGEGSVFMLAGDDAFRTGVDRKSVV